MAGGSSASSDGALWAGFTFMTAFTLLFMRASYHSRSKTSRVYHYLTTLITALAALSYLVMALKIGNVWVRFLDWFLTTPMLLADLACLANMAAPEILYLAVIDMMMVASGYLAQVAEDPVQIWPMFAFSAGMFLIIVWALLSYLRKIARDHTGTVEARAYKFLAVWTLALWTVYPLLFVLEKSHVVTKDIEDIIHCVLDILAKGVFGVLLVGSREALDEGATTWEALLAMAALGIDPLRRRASMAGANMPAIDYLTKSGSVSRSMTDDGSDDRVEVDVKAPRAADRFATSQHERTFGNSVGRNTGKALLQGISTPERTVARTPLTAPAATAQASARRMKLPPGGLKSDSDTEPTQPIGSTQSRRGSVTQHGEPKRGAVSSPGGFVMRGVGPEASRSFGRAAGNDAGELLRGLLEAAARDPSVLSGLAGFSPAAPIMPAMDSPAPEDTEETPVDARANRTVAAEPPAAPQSHQVVPPSSGHFPAGRDASGEAGGQLPPFGPHAAAPPAQMLGMPFGNAAIADLAQRLQALMAAGGPLPAGMPSAGGSMMSSSVRPPSGTGNAHAPATDSEMM